ncbi:MAG: HNH endonuclease [Acidobacteria bacterium]|nr:HNH endonuclease [Acidobacteriota bacterium]
MQSLHVHHLTYRSHSGGDVEPNLITLCATCHSRQHSTY